MSYGMSLGAAEGFQRPVLSSHVWAVAAEATTLIRPEAGGRSGSGSGGGPPEAGAE